MIDVQWIAETVGKDQIDDGEMRWGMFTGKIWQTTVQSWKDLGKAFVLQWTNNG